MIQWSHISVLSRIPFYDKFTLYSVCVAGEQFAYEKPFGESRGNCLFLLFFSICVELVWAFYTLE